MMKSTSHCIGMLYVTVLSVAAISAPTRSASADGDLNLDGLVDGSDLSIVLASWGPCPSPCGADLNGDGFVDGADLSIWLGSSTSPSDPDPGTIDSSGLFDPGTDPPPGEPDDSIELADGGADPADPFEAMTIHAVPLPAPAWLTIAGLVGAYLIRRRLTP